MATKTINLSLDAYELLKAHKKEGESFSDVIRRLLSKPSLDEVLAEAPEDEWKELAEMLREHDREFKKSFRMRDVV